MSAADNLEYGSVNWREVVRKNTYRTYFVIATFLIVFFLLGIFVDTIWRYSEFANAYYNRYGIELPISRVFYSLATFQIPPYATMIISTVAVIWVFVTFSMYDKIMLSGTEYQEIAADNQDPLARRVYNVVEEMKVAAGMRYMPKVFLIDANYMNAFASGYSEKSAMVAITTKLANALNRDELQAVMAHELTHIRNQDIKLNLFTMVLSNMMLIIMDFLFYSALFSSNSNNNNNNRNNNAAAFFIIIMILRYVLQIFTIFMMLFLSRTREYMADAGAVELMRTNMPMANALIKIANDSKSVEAQYSYKHNKNENLRRASYIFDPLSAGISSGDMSDLFSTHPSIEKRLASIGVKLR
ncbi:zinc metalloprotease HtpX [Francisella tularensis subsp. novicida]|uniref:zinc metalloprotease HtpX n=1 Tax=Francisella tularensis TaxID=263 RepID=UPI000158AD46|nr:zinc metalloprotease HtpX [Francisella tularensis]AJI45586.1 peptidase M48 family protein [Francisella tularensis subsp. novicida F6168]AJJ48034.1 peptidase M48 family protein [Francisella tularensis subsp. novicida]APC99226.1 peptidase M48 family protein [Francisella tularensis subsp. novicida]EDN35739.1 heat shock protein HtpX [Francisella tularensis subsp. novicida GA99-3549]KFJ69644.1 peptidase M48 family protein [Francisella tularensis subsp. novicida]